MSITYCDLLLLHNISDKSCSYRCTLIFFTVVFSYLLFTFLSPQGILPIGQDLCPIIWLFIYKKPTQSKINSYR